MSMMVHIYSYVILLYNDNSDDQCVVCISSKRLQGRGKEVEVMRLHVPRALQPLAGPVAKPGAGWLGGKAIKEPGVSWYRCLLMLILGCILFD